MTWDGAKAAYLVAAALMGDTGAVRAQNSPAPAPQAMMEVRLTAPATMPVRIHAWESGRASEPGTSFTGSVAGALYEGSTQVVSDCTPVVGRVLRVDERSSDGSPLDVVLELDWASVPGAGGKPEMASVVTEPLYVRLAPDDLRNQRVFWFHTAAPLTVELPVVNGEVEKSQAAEESSLYPHPRKRATQP